MKKIPPYILAITLCFAVQTTSAQKITPVDSLSDFSEFPGKKHGQLAGLLKLNETASTVVIIDSKIYTLTLKEYLELKKEEILNIEVIKDDKSESDIKQILIIKKRPAPVNQ